MNIWLDRGGRKLASELEQVIGQDDPLLQRLMVLDLKAAIYLLRSAADRCEIQTERRSYIVAGLNRAERLIFLTAELDRFVQLDSDLSPEEWGELPAGQRGQFIRAWVEAEIELEVLEGVASPYRLLRHRMGGAEAEGLWAQVTSAFDLGSREGVAQFNRLFFHAAKARNPASYIRAALNNAQGRKRPRALA